MEALSDENVSSIAHKSLDLSDRDKQMILGIIQQLGDMNENELDDREATP